MTTMHPRGPLTTFPIYLDAIKSLSEKKSASSLILFLGILLPTFLESLAKMVWSLEAIPPEGVFRGGIHSFEESLIPYFQKSFWTHALTTVSILISFFLLLKNYFNSEERLSLKTLFSGIFLYIILNMIALERVLLGPFLLFTLMGSMAYVLMTVEKMGLFYSLKRSLFLDYVRSNQPGIKLNVFFIFLNSGILFYAWHELLQYLFENLLTIDQWLGLPLELWSSPFRADMFFLAQKILLALRDTLFVLPLGIWAACLGTLYKTVQNP